MIMKWLTFILVFGYIACYTGNANNLQIRKTFAHVNSFDGIFEIKVNVTELTDQPENQEEHTKCLESTEFELNIKWRIKTCRRNLIVPNGADEVDIFLEPIFSEQTMAWSFPTIATFKLIPVNKTCPPIEGKIDHDFNKDSRTRVIKNLIIWKDLYEDYVNKEEATFELTLTMKSPNRIAELEQLSTKFQMQIKQLNDFSDQLSNEVVLRGVRWRVLATSMNDHLGVFLHANENDMLWDLAWNVNCSFQLISPDESHTVPAQFTNVPFGLKILMQGFEEFMKWSDLFDLYSQYVVNNAATLRVELSVEDPKPMP